MAFHGSDNLFLAWYSEFFRIILAPSQLTILDLQTPVSAEQLIQKCIQRGNSDLVFQKIKWFESEYIETIHGYGGVVLKLWGQKTIPKC